MSEQEPITMFQATTGIYRKFVEAGIQALPDSIIGRIFTFIYQSGSHHAVLVGTVTGVQLSDEGGLEIYVSIPSFRGLRLDALSFSNGKWWVKARLHDGQTTQNFEGGTFILR